MKKLMIAAIACCILAVLLFAGYKMVLGSGVSSVGDLLISGRS